MSNLVAETLQGIARNRLGELFLFCNNTPEKQPFEKVTIPPELRRKHDGLSKREIEEVCPQTKHQWNQNSRYRGAAKAWDDGLGSEKEVTREGKYRIWELPRSFQYIYNKEAEEKFQDGDGNKFQDGLLIRFQLDDGKVRDGAFITNVQLPSNKVVLGPQKSIETSEGVGEIMPAPGMIIEFPQRWEQGLNQTKFNKMCKKHILVVRTVDATAIGGAVESRELQLLDKYFLSIGHTLALPDHKEDFEKDIMPLLKPYAGKPTEPPFLHRFRKKELLLAIQANKLKKAAGTRKSGRVKIDRSLADEVIEESPQKKNKKAGPKKQKESEIETLIRKAAMTRLSRRRKRRRKKKTKKGKGDKEEEEKGGKEALGEAEGLSKLRADISNMSSSISQLVKTLQERPVVRVRRERAKKRRRLDDTDADDSEEED
eukprot:g26256.t1